MSDGTAACNIKSSPSSSQQVKWSNGSVIENVLHISAAGDADVIVVTEDGNAYKGYFSSVSETPIVLGNAISSTGGQNPACILTGDESTKDVLCQSNDGWNRPGLPNGFNPVQITASYGFVCALDTSGAVWCWSNGGNMGGGLSEVIGSAPSELPFDKPMKFISAGQNSICGVQYEGGVKCKFSYYDSRYLPAKEAVSLAETPEGFLPNAEVFQATWGKGVAINEDGSVVYFEGENQISGISNAVSAGGHREAITVIDAAGGVFLVDGGNASKVATSAPAAAADCPL